MDAALQVNCGMDQLIQKSLSTVCWGVKGGLEKHFLQIVFTLPVTEGKASGPSDSVGDPPTHKYGLRPTFKNGKAGTMEGMFVCFNFVLKKTTDAQVMSTWGWVR